MTGVDICYVKAVARVLAKIWVSTIVYIVDCGQD